MHRDKRLGLALGILLLGIVGAFFFRNEDNPTAAPPKLADAAKLDAQIAENPVGPYLTGLEDDDEIFTSSRNVSRSSDSDPWGTPDFLRSGNANRDLPGANGPPSPIDTRVSTVDGIPIPRENAAWEPVKETNPRTNNVRTQPVSMRDEQGYLIHRVQKGDTLSELAQRYLGSSARFGEIYEANRNLLRSPNDLRLGIPLRIPQKETAKSISARRANRIETQPISIRDEETSRAKPTFKPATQPRHHPFHRKNALCRLDDRH
jgi:phage tail protein X